MVRSATKLISGVWVGAGLGGRMCHMVGCFRERMREAPLFPVRPGTGQGEGGDVW